MILVLIIRGCHRIKSKYSAVSAISSRTEFREITPSKLAMIVHSAKYASLTISISEQTFRAFRCQSCPPGCLPFPPTGMPLMISKHPAHLLLKEENLLAPSHCSCSCFTPLNPKTFVDVTMSMSVLVMRQEITHHLDNLDHPFPFRLRQSAISRIVSFDLLTRLEGRPSSASHLLPGGWVCIALS